MEVIRKASGCMVDAYYYYGSLDLNKVDVILLSFLLGVVHKTCKRSTCITASCICTPVMTSETTRVQAYGTSE